MEAILLGSSIEAKNEDAEACYSPRARAVSSVGRAPARQSETGCSAEFRGVAPSGTYAASLSENADESSVTKRTPNRRSIRKHVAWMLHGCCIAAILAGLLSAPKADAKQSLPPLWRQFALTCKAEQPATLKGYTGNRWMGVAWEQTTNYTYKGGCGFTQANWDAHKRPGQPKYMSSASAVEQLWAAYRIYRFYLNQSGSHRYAATVWDANRNILGWYGFSDAEWKRAHK